MSTTRAEESETGAAMGWERWGSGGIDARLARIEARRGLFSKGEREAALVTLGRYEVGRLLGRGGMGSVYLAWDPALGRNVAVKVLRSASSDDDAERVAKRLRIQREAAALGKLTHPNVVRVYDVGEEDGRTYVAMEYVAEGTLRDWRSRADGSPDVREVLRVYTCAGRGLAAAHAHGLLHRDFKPDNVLVADDGRVLVSDFGLVRPTGSDPLTDASYDESEITEEVTRTGALLGTPAYMAPELFAGEVANAASDQFAFCVSLFETIVGRRPFAERYSPARTPWATFSTAESAALRRMPRWARRLLIRGLQFDPRDRFESMEALLGVLERRATRRRGAWWLAAACGAVGIGAYLLPSEPRVVDHALCEPGAPHVVISDEAAGSMRRALQGAAFPGAEASIERALDPLLLEAAGWVAQVEAACASVPKRSVAHRARVLDCLQSQRHDLAAVADMLEDVDAQTFGPMVEFVIDRPPAIHCDDERALRGRVPPPGDPALAERVEAQRALLAEGLILVRLRELERARAIAAAVRSSPEADAFRPLHLEAAYLEAEILVRAEQRSDALAVLRSLEFDAESQGHDRVALGASILLLELLVDADRPPAEFETHLDHASARAIRLGDDGAQVNLEFMRAEHERRVGRPEHAVDVAQAALELARERLGPQHPQVAYADDYVSGALTELDRYDAALEHKRAALAVLEQTYGPESVAISVLFTTAGTVAKLAGEHELSKAWHERAIEVVEARLGPDSARLMVCLDGAAASALLRGEAEAALRLLERQIRIQAREGVASERARSQRVLALVQAGQLDEASRAYRQATRALQADVPRWDRVDTLRVGAQLALRLGDLEAARERALQAIEASQTAPHGTIYPLLLLARAQMRDGAIDDAARSLRRAVEAGAARRGTEPLLVAELRVTELEFAEVSGATDLPERRAAALQSVRRVYGPEHPTRRAVEQGSPRSGSG